MTDGELMELDLAIRDGLTYRDDSGVAQCEGLAALDRLVAALRDAAERARGLERQLRTPQWFYDPDGDSIDDLDEYADYGNYSDGAVFYVNGARDTGRVYLLVKCDERGGFMGTVEITKDQYDAAGAAGKDGR